MKTRTGFSAIFLLAVSGLILTSCGKTPRPEINLVELGLEDSRVATAGDELHIEAEIVAEGVIDVITVELHMEEEGGEEIEGTFDEYSGLKNTLFHSHLEIPEGTTPGTYHFHMTVTDLEGYQASVEAEVTIEQPSGK